jgi:hypothetical protein
MTGKSMNWKRVNSRKQMRQQGTEDKKAERSSFNPPFNPRKRGGPAQTKAEQRARAEKALAEWKERQGSK